MAGTWEVWSKRRGDIARALFYMDVRYEGDSHTVTGRTEPQLILTNDVELIVAAASNTQTAYMGRLDTLIQWHKEDPVDDVERWRNDVIEFYQGNRNPFIDHPSTSNASSSRPATISSLPPSCPIRGSTSCTTTTPVAIRTRASRSPAPPERISPDSSWSPTTAPMASWAL